MSAQTESDQSHNITHNTLKYHDENDINTLTKMTNLIEIDKSTVQTILSSTTLTSSTY